MSVENLKKQYTKLCMNILHHRFRYYVLSKPAISDEEYDELEKQLEEFERKHPSLVHKESPTKTPGSSLPETYPRSIRMLYQYP